MKGFCVLLFFLFITPLSASTYYVDASRGNDLNDGLSEQTAWRSLSKVRSHKRFFLPGDVIAFKKGEIWFEELEIMDLHGSYDKPILFTSYGLGSKPIFTVVKRQALKWNYVGNNVWKATNITRHPKRLLIDGEERMAASSSNFSELGTSIKDLAEWFWGDIGDGENHLYIYSMDSPENHEISFSNSPDARSLDILRSSYLNFSNLDIQGGYFESIAISGCNNITLSEMTVGKYSANGIKVVAFTYDFLSYLSNTNIVIENNEINASYAFNYSEAGIYQGSSERGGADGIFVSNCDGGAIRNNTLTNWGHSSISLTADGENKQRYNITNMKVYNNFSSSPDIAYGGRFGMDGLAQNNEWYYNFVENSSVRSQLNGSNNHIHHNVFKNVKNSPLKINPTGQGLSIQNYSIECEGNIIENNLFLNCEAEGIGLEGNNKGGNVTKNIIRNNIIFNCGLDNIGIKVYKNSYGSNVGNFFKNNIIHNTNSAKTIKYYNEILDVSEFNKQIDSDQNVENNLATNPLFQNDAKDWHLRSNSPAIDKGTEVLSKLDRDGVIIDDKPDIGIFEWNESLDINADAGSDVIICSGESTTLTATGGSSYLWSTGDTTKSITVSPDSTQIYTVTASDLNGNSDSDEVEVQVNGVIANAGSDVTINEGDGVTLKATGGGTYLWSTGATTQSITVSPTSTRDYTVTVSLNGCIDTDKVQVIVNRSTGSVTANAGSDVMICSGESTTLTATGGSSYLWSTGATTKSITVSPNSTQIYTVTASDLNGNSDSDEVEVQVNGVIANAGSDVTINEGDGVTLKATGGGTYLWSTGATTQSITVSPTSTRDYTVTVSLNGCIDSDKVRVIVNQSKGSVTANAGSDVMICSGESATLTATGGSSYLWSTGATTKSITVSPNSTQIYTVTASDLNGNSDSDEVEVQVNGVIANAGSDVTINEGDSVTLKATGGGTYLWNTGATTQSITVSPTSTREYTVTVSLNGCKDTDQVKISVNSDDSSNPLIVQADAGEDMTVCLGQTITLTGNGGDSYRWNTGEVGKEIKVTPSRTTTYELEVTSEGVTSTDTVVITVENCEISNNEDELVSSDLVLYPNPTSGFLNVEIENMNHESEFIINDMKGSIIYHEVLDYNSLNRYSRQIDLTGQTKGIYLVRLLSQHHSIVKKIVHI